jgi:hypothetical protein
MHCQSALVQLGSIWTRFSLLVLVRIPMYSCCFESKDFLDEHRPSFRNRGIVLFLMLRDCITPYRVTARGGHATVVRLPSFPGFKKRSGLRELGRCRITSFMSNKVCSMDVRVLHIHIQVDELQWVEP